MLQLSTKKIGHLEIISHSRHSKIPFLEDVVSRSLLGVPFKLRLHDRKTKHKETIWTFCELKYWSRNVVAQRKRFDRKTKINLNQNLPKRNIILLIESKLREREKLINKQIWNSKKLDKTSSKILWNLDTLRTNSLLSYWWIRKLW